MWPSGASFKGTNDSDVLSITDEEPAHNDGNFRAILRMRLACGDVKLKNHLQDASLNATYISPLIQNEIICTVGEIIQNRLVGKVNLARCFSVLVDETTDISQTEQLSLCVRYVDQSNDIENRYSPREDFLDFVAVKSTKGEDLAQVILQ